MDIGIWVAGVDKVNWRRRDTTWELSLRELGDWMKGLRPPRYLPYISAGNKIKRIEIDRNGQGVIRSAEVRRCLELRSVSVKTSSLLVQTGESRLIFRRPIQIQLSFRRKFSVSASTQAKQNSIPAAYYRGGTSRALIFHRKDLPLNREDWRPIFLGVLGSPDPNGRQLDGIGGGISSLSKICVVGPSKRPDAAVDFTFVQVGIRNDGIDYAGNCGNMTSAIGPYAVDSGLFRPNNDTGSATVRIYNTNTDKLIDCTFPVSEGEAVAHGAFSIDGVSGTASKIQLDFIGPAGSKTGKLLSTGNVVDTFDGVRATCVDVANPSIFVTAQDMGIDGTMLPEQIQNQPELLKRLESVRRQATVAMGIAKSLDEVPPSIPKICFVSPTSRHPLLSGEQLDPSSANVVVRTISTGQPHGAIPLTTAFGAATAARIPGSTVQECVSPQSGSKSDGFVIGHPSGELVVEAELDGKDKVSRATVFRTARRLMVGKVFWK